MMKIKLLTRQNYQGVRNIDELTQAQYLGEKWNKLDITEKEGLLKSRESEFDINVGTGYSFVAHSGKEIVGFLLAYKTLPFHDTVYIRHIAIKPEYQGRGIGILLYKRLISKARKNGIKKIMALINLDNPNSIRMHEKVGFELKDRKEATLKLV